ncbi:hypothetical protein KJY73_04775 [Bowmanella sp. Y26]|uniref:hypothetical protein n=1 Tax=Bowmanella yangjiangensis TaxID=2811230 RepID=UPI001BDBDF57|nr:hypothetical protein [Bowmanella yangjiangensis]MBT1062875.1 hypothetical protein [Bowmanella yangjiangensis]
MLDKGDALCIGVPALRYFRQRFPEASLHFMGFAQGKELVKAAEPDATVSGLEQHQWPEHIIPAMETFLGLAEQIIAEGYSQIVCLDTAFMPCFLSRFLKDAGEPVVGNYISLSVQELIDQFQSQQLRPEYVNDAANYLRSDFFAMARWHTPWWQSSPQLDYGYPEFYLRHCCGFDQIEMDMSVNLPESATSSDQKGERKVVALAPFSENSAYDYPFADQLKAELTALGYQVWSIPKQDASVRNTLMRLKASDLLVTVPFGAQWQATAVNCASLVICGDMDPRRLIPDYATDPHIGPIPADSLAQSIHSIFTESADS